MTGSDGLVFPETDMAEYQEYQRRIVAESDAAVESPGLLDQLRELGIDVDSFRGVSP
jgi:hypothetical protein